jgi:hypothetical protein
VPYRVLVIEFENGKRRGVAALRKTFEGLQGMPPQNWLSVTETIIQDRIKLNHKLA